MESMKVLTVSMNTLALNQAQTFNVLSRLN
jgi:hypothetical protein